MKKIFLLILIFYPIALFSQPSGGNGTAGSPYTGVITTPWTLSGDKYCGNLTVSSGTFTISAGSTLRFGTGNSLTITGTGALYAVGNSSSYITFTAAATSWGHIYFNNPSETYQSNLKYCIIELGDTRSLSPSYGGGIYSNDFNNLIISYCTIRNNKATHGGGIMAYNNSASPTITNCLISENTATTSGGGVYLPSGCTSIITNCIVNNNSTGNGGGGGIFLDASGNVRVINSNFVKNTTSSAARGYNIQYYNAINTTTRPRFINCVAWGSDNSITHISSAVVATDFVNCAIQDVSTPASNYTNCINLSATNNAVTGPNFVDPDLPGLDWSIKFVSPCRDAGSTPSPTVPTDYLGNSRIGAYDIGAYEVQYCVWTGNTDGTWEEASNWANGFMPVSTRDVIIPAGRPNYPNSSAYVVGANKYLILEPSAQATFGTLDMNSTATLWLKSSSYGATELIASLMVDYYELPVGIVKIELNLQGNGSMWHYISPPVTSVPATVFSSNGAGVTEYRENLISTDMNNGWVTSTGYHYDTSIPTPAWVNEGWTWTNMVAGRGYNYYSATNKVFTINGTPNTGDFNINLAYNTKGTDPAYPDAQGWNLIGNPYTCGLDWDVVVAANSIWDDVEAAIYFRKNNLTYYYVDGSIVPNDYNNPGNFITPMQGFFIKSKTPSIDLLIPATARTHTISKRYKGASLSPHKGSSTSHIRIQFENTSMSDQIVLSFNESATSGFDNRFDARKIFPSSDKLSISSSLGGTEYAINSIPFPVNSVSVPLIINASTTGSYTIKAIELQGLEEYSIVLVDKLQNESVNLSYTGSYSFDASAGISADRFVITVSNILTSLPETTTSSKPFNIYSSEEMINIQTLSDNWNGEKGKINILDMTGRTISVSNQMEFTKGDIIRLPLNITSGIYVVEINSGIKRFVGKVVVR